MISFTLLLFTMAFLPYARVQFILPGRSSLIQSAIAEAKAYVSDFEAREAQLLSSSSSDPALTRFSKGPSPKAMNHRRARMIYEEAVRRGGKVLTQNFFSNPSLSPDELTQMYLTSGCSDIISSAPVCNFSTVNQYRTLDGTCNNLQNPLWGAAATPYRRILFPYYDDGFSALRGSMQRDQLNTDSLAPGIGPFLPPNPNPRMVSSNVVSDKGLDEPKLSHMVMQWGQFIAHDITFSPGMSRNCTGQCTNTGACSPISVMSEDEVFGVGTLRNGQCIPFSRTIPACGDASSKGDLHPRQQINDITAFIDGSTIYGSDSNISTALREFKGGRLRVSNSTGTKVNLPQSVDGFLAGDKRVNDVTGLIVMHTIWLREHNRVAAILSDVNAHWDDERLFQETRKIVGAEIQRITYYEYLPVVMGQEWFDKLIGQYGGYNQSVNPSIPNEFAAAAFRFGHSLVRPSFSRLNKNRNNLIGDLSLVNAFGGSSTFTSSSGTDPLLQGLLSDNARRRDEFMDIGLTQKLFEKVANAYNPTPDSAGLDLASLSIQRGRDHGLPPYTIVKDFCQQTYNINSSFNSGQTAIKILQTYGSKDTIDLLVGGLAERSLNGSLVGATFACILANAFYNLRNGDRFYFENPSVFTAEQRVEINKTSLSNVICSNGDDIGLIQRNAFLTNQPLVPCYNNFSIDLGQWKETCYVKAMVNSPMDRTSSITIRINSRSVKLYTNSTSQTVPPNQPNNVPMCLQVQCPSNMSPTVVAAMGNSLDGYDLMIGTSSRLPPSNSGMDDVYRASWPSSLLAIPSGFYSSQQACVSGTTIGLRFIFM